MSRPGVQGGGVRVLHVMECTIGGTRRHLVDAALGQRAAGLDVGVAASALRQPAFEDDLRRLERSGVRVHRVPMVREIAPFDDARRFAELRRIVRDESPDVVHTHSSKAGVLGRLASLLEGRGARVHTPHTFAFLFDAMFGAAKRRLFLEIERGLAGETARTIAVSASEARTIRASGVVPPERVRVVGNGIDPAPWMAARPVPRSELARDADGPVALVVGLLNAAKGQEILLEALTRPGLARLSVAFAGSGPDAERLASRAEALGVARRVRFLGYRDDVPALLAAADFLILPSRWEGLPYAVLEAMAAAKPVVATPVDGAVDLVQPGWTGEVARAIDADALAEAVVRLLAQDADALRAAGQRAREIVLARHTRDAMIAGLSAVYREVL